MNKAHKQKLAELNNICNGRRRSSSSDYILLFIAQVTADTNQNIKWLIWLAGLSICTGLSILIALAVRGL